MIRIDIIGAAIRQHLHIQPGDRMPPILIISSPFNDHSCLGAHIAGPAKICYDPSAAPHDEAWIETSWPVVPYDWPIMLPPKPGATLCHLNSNHQRANRYAVREQTNAAEKQVLLVRQPSGLYERAWRSVETTGPSWIVLACKANGVDPLACGAMVWLQSYHPMLIDRIAYRGQSAILQSQQVAA
jgi:hypothetical protein